jgi:hypothetical protein
MNDSTTDPIAVIGPLALACLRGECPLEVLRDAVAETGWDMPALVAAAEHRAVAVRYLAARDRRRPRPARPRRAAEALGWAATIAARWRECQAAEALRAGPPGGAGTYYHETPR